MNKQKKLPGLSAAELERLALLNEECAEVQQAISKILRHGYASYHPHKPELGDNRHMLSIEVGHVLAALHLMTQAGDLGTERIGVHQKAKLDHVEIYLHHQRKRR